MPSGSSHGAASDGTDGATPASTSDQTVTSTQSGGCSAAPAGARTGRGASDLALFASAIGAVVAVSRRRNRRGRNRR